MRHTIQTLVKFGAIAAMASPLMAEQFATDIWADNWFEMRIDGELIAQDSVPITTERSFNAESFEFSAQRPFTIAVVAKDFKENDTGLEYIGTPRQQMGDGGLIMQIKDSAGETLVTSNDDWQCLVTHRAPLDKACADVSNPIAGVGSCDFTETETPDGWDTAEFDASNWPQAQIYSSDEVRPKGGYDDIDWSPDAQLIWGADIETDNTLLCRITVQ